MNRQVEKNPEYVTHRLAEAAYLKACGAEYKGMISDNPRQIEFVFDGDDVAKYLPEYLNNPDSEARKFIEEYELLKRQVVSEKKKAGIKHAVRHDS